MATRLQNSCRHSRLEALTPSQSNCGAVGSWTIIPRLHHCLFWMCASFYPLTLALFGIPIPTAAVEPASTGKIAPVIHRAWSLARKVTAHAASQPLPSVPSRLLLRRASRASSLMPPAYIIGVYNICGFVSNKSVSNRYESLPQDRRS